jgi:hypothetical protein
MMIKKIKIKIIIIKIMMVNIIIRKGSRTIGHWEHQKLKRYHKIILQIIILIQQRNKIQLKMSLKTRVKNNMLAKLAK